MRLEEEEVEEVRSCWKVVAGEGRREGREEQ